MPHTYDSNIMHSLLTFDSRTEVLNLEPSYDVSMYFGLQMLKECIHVLVCRNTRLECDRSCGACRGHVWLFLPCVQNQEAKFNIGRNA